MKMKIPKIIRINKLKYRVHFVEKIRSENLIEAVKYLILRKYIQGQFQPVEKKILLMNTDLNINSTLFHELSHAIFWQLAEKYVSCNTLYHNEYFIDNFGELLNKQKTKEIFLKKNKHKQKRLLKIVYSNLADISLYTNLKLLKISEKKEKIINDLIKLLKQFYKENLFTRGLK